MLMTFINGLTMVISVYKNGLESFVKFLNGFEVFSAYFGFLVLHAMESWEMNSFVASILKIQ